MGTNWYFDTKHISSSPLSQLQQKVQQVMKDVGYLEVLLFGLDTWKSLASLQIVASVCTVAQEMGANLLLVTLKHADNESSLKSLKILMRLRLTKVAKRSIWKRAVEQEDQRMKDAEVVEQPPKCANPGCPHDIIVVIFTLLKRFFFFFEQQSGRRRRSHSHERHRQHGQRLCFEGKASEDEEDQARPAAFRTLPPADTGPALALHEPELRYSYDVCEIFMPPRAAHRARERKLVGGWSLDEHFVDSVTNRTWNLVKDKDVQEVLNMVRKHRPRLLAVSPPQETLKMVVAAIKIITLQRTRWLFHA